MHDMTVRGKGEYNYSLSAVVLVFLVPGLAGLMFGYDIGATSFALVSLMDSALSSVLWSEYIEQSASWQGFLVSAASFGSLLASSIILWTGIGDLVGRKRELQIGGLLYLVGGFMESMAIHSSTNGLWWLMTGRCIYGLGIGCSMHAAPTYLGEMAPASIRGLLVSLKEAAIVTGMLLGYIVGSLFSTVPGGWAYMYAASIAGSVTLLILTLLIPPSCRWLMLKGHDQRAMEALSFVYPENAEQMFEAMKSMHEDSATMSLDSALPDQSSSTLMNPKNRAPLLAGVGLVVLQQITGQPSVLSYTSSIFESIGLSSSSSVLVGVWKLLSTLYSATVVEKFGRKILLYTGCSLMLSALLFLSILLDRAHSPFGQGLIVLAMLAYIGGYQIGFGPISWLMTAELFPLEARGQAVAFAVQMNFLLNACVQFTVPLLQQALGLRGMFTLFALLTGYSLYFIRTFVPETKGLSLEEIEQQFNRMRGEERTGEKELLVPKV